MDRAVQGNGRRARPHADDGWDQTRETIDGFTTVDKSFYPGLYPPDYDYQVRYVGPPQQSMYEVPPSISPAHVLTLVQEAIEAAREETQHSAPGTNDLNGDLKPGLTIDLGHRNIQRIPEEVVNIIKDDIERLALPHNQIWQFPYRFAECAHLRYLNLRSNAFREFPRAVYKLPSLEILDISRNKLKSLPEELMNLTSLKVLSLQKNRIDKLPLCIGDMITLQVLKLEANPLLYPPKEVLEIHVSDYLPESANDHERDKVITARVKWYLKRQSTLGKANHDSGGESRWVFQSTDDYYYCANLGITESEDQVKTPRPTKRLSIGRFPIKVNTSGSESASDARSSAISRPPPIPSRSHFRVPSMQNAALRRPGVMPLVIGNERSRSNSESILQASQRTKRMGMVTRKTSDLGTVDETPSKRNSHLRGVSHGSALQNKHNVGQSSGGNSSSSPVSPSETERQRGPYVRRLSSLPEHKRESYSPDALVEGAKGILYSLFQLQPHISSLIGVVGDGSFRRTSSERVFFNASFHIEELDKELYRFDKFTEENYDIQVRSNEIVKNTCATCVKIYQHVGWQLLGDVRNIVLEGDQRYVRTLLLQLFGSLVEISNACSGVCMDLNGETSLPPPPPPPPLPQVTRKFQGHDRSITPTRNHPNPSGRLRSATVVQYPDKLSSSGSMQPSVPLKFNGNSRSNTLTSSVAQTPRSGESFPTPGMPLIMSRTNTMLGTEDAEEERLFEKIFLKLTIAHDYALKALPSVNIQFVRCMEACKKKDTGWAQVWIELNDQCMFAIQTAEALKTRLSTIKLKEPGIRSQKEFWQLCNTFVKAFVDMALGVKLAKQHDLIPADILQVLRPVQKSIKEVGILIETSPWKYLAANPQTLQSRPPPITHSMIQSGLQYSSSSGSSNVTALASPAMPGSSPYVTPLPATPLSAALGPAAQATVPSTPSSHVTNGFLGGNGIERTDFLPAMPSRR
ncbi:MAG: RAM signaling network component [Pycnora praestabilis]|nr:MAG: RAM signaling network component [Pycnora praestabilis]